MFKEQLHLIKILVIGVQKCTNNESDVLGATLFNQDLSYGM